MINGLTNDFFSLVYLLGPIGFLLVMILQAIIAPIPSELILVLGGATFGLYLGTILGGVGEILGAITAFFIAKKLGRKVVNKLVPKSALEFGDKWFYSWGKWAVLMGRLAPFVPFDGISYFAGLTKIKFIDFITATSLGAFPRALFYSWVGTVGVEVLKKGVEKEFYMIMTIISIFISLILIGKYYILKKYRG